MSIASLRLFAMGVFALMAVALSLLAGGTARADTSVTFKASDGVEINGDYHGSANRDRPLVLLFHMAGSNRGEYRSVAPKLVALGWDALAIDQRSGGPGFGAKNETVARLGRSTSFDEALKDLDAALTWALRDKPGRPVVIWGSSYSAALVFVLAAARPRDVTAVLAFSPGEYLNRSGVVTSAAKNVGVPVFLTSASDPGEIAAARAILSAVATPAARNSQFVPRSGVHGSSTLDPARNPRGAEENWTAVQAFLASVKP